MPAKSSMTDADFEELKTSLNNAIHEIVFACANAENNELSDAAQCLITAQATIESVAEKLVELGA